MANDIATGVHVNINSPVRAKQYGSKWKSMVGRQSIIRPTAASSTGKKKKKKEKESAVAKVSNALKMFMSRVNKAEEDPKVSIAKKEEPPKTIQEMVGAWDRVAEVKVQKKE